MIRRPPRSTLFPLRDALPISLACLGIGGPLHQLREDHVLDRAEIGKQMVELVDEAEPLAAKTRRSEEHTSELQSRQYLVCRLLLEKKHKREKSFHRWSSRHRS